MWAYMPLLLYSSKLGEMASSQDGWVMDEGESLPDSISLYGSSKYMVFLFVCLLYHIDFRVDLLPQHSRSYPGLNRKCNFWVKLLPREPNSSYHVHLPNFLFLSPPNSTPEAPTGHHRGQVMPVTWDEAVVLNSEKKCSSHLNLTDISEK